MPCCSNKAHTLIMGLAIWIGSLEGRKEAVVDVDDGDARAVDEVRAQDLHVPGQNCNVCITQQLQDLLLCLLLLSLLDWHLRPNNQWSMSVS